MRHIVPAVAAIGLGLVACPGDDSGAGGLTRAEADGLYAAKSVEGQVAALAARVSELEEGRGKLDQAIAVLQADVSGLKSDVAGVRSDVAALQTRFSTFDDDIAEVRGDVAGLDAKLAGVTAKLDALASKVVALDGTSGRLDALDAAVAELARAQGQPSACPPDMVAVGEGCVDRFEASIWARKDGQPVDCAMLQAAVDEALAAGWSGADVYYGERGSECAAGSGIAMCAFRQYGSPPGCMTSQDCDDYPEEFRDSGDFSTPLYACSIRGVMPSRSMTWFQAAQACVASGRHLISNEEWQAAVAGTPDPGTSNGADGSCNTGSWGGGDPVRRTGLGSEGCVSAFGAEDMIGNLWEWTSLWGQGGPGFDGFEAGSVLHPWPATFGDGGDATFNVGGMSSTTDTGTFVPGMPFAALRGGRFDNGDGAGAFAFDLNNAPSDWQWSIGTRCARRR